jgi:serine/threonine protein kinase
VPVTGLDFLAPPQAPDELGRLGSYRVLQILGKGGMGVVLLAEDPQLRRKLALKAMLPALAANEVAKERFLREARAAAAVEHEHIVAIYKVEEDSGVPFIAMPLLKGEALEDRLKREGKLPVTEVVRIGREAAEGLAAAHAAGLIHRDIKPSNLWLEGEPGALATGGGRVKLLDFGLARSSGDGARLTHTGAILGTPAYMAPEQAGGKMDARADLFSLGCVLYRMATGKPAFHGDDVITTLMAVVTQHPPPPCEVNPRLPRALSDLIVRLLAKKADDRPPSARAVADALRDLERDRSAVDRTVPLPKRRPPWPLWLALGAAAPLLLVGLVTLVVPWPRRGPARSPEAVATASPTPAKDGDRPPAKTEPPVEKKTPPQAEPPDKGKAPPNVKRPTGLLPPLDPAQADKANRNAAEAIIRRGGVVCVECLGQPNVTPPISNVELLPREPFRVHTVQFTTGRDLDESDLVPLEELEDLYIISLFHSRVSHVLYHLARARKLNQVSILSVPFNADGIKPLAWFPSLQHVYLVDSSVTDDMLAAVSLPPNLGSLGLDGSAIGDATVAHLREFAGLAYLSLARTKVTDAGVKHLKRSFSLTHLDLVSTDTGDEALRHVKELPRLRGIGCGRRTTDQGLADFLAARDDLEILSLSYTKVTDSGLKAVSRQQQLRSLALTGLPITDAGLEHIRSLKQLTTLDMPFTRVTDKGLVHLAALNNLTWLQITQAAFTDDGLLRLANLPVLKYLYVIGTRVTAKGAEQFHAERKKLGLPPCTVTGAGS